MKYIIGVLALLASLSANAALTNLGTLTTGTQSYTKLIEETTVDSYTFNVASPFTFTSAFAAVGGQVTSFTTSLTNLDTGIIFDDFIPSITNPNSFPSSIATGILASGNYVFTLTAGVNPSAPGNFYTGGFQINAVPEPESYAMFLAGLGLLSFASRRKV